MLDHTADQTQTIDPVDTAGSTEAGGVNDATTDSTTYPPEDPDWRPRTKTFSEAMADAHETLMKATGNLAASWEEATQGLARTVSVLLPRPDEDGDGRAWTGSGWRVVVDDHDELMAWWDGNKDPEGFAVALLAARRLIFDQRTTRQRSAATPAHATRD